MSVYAAPLSMGSFSTDLDHAFDEVDTIVQETSYIGTFTYPAKAVIDSGVYAYDVLQKSSRPFEVLSKTFRRLVKWYNEDEDKLGEELFDTSLVDSSKLFDTSLVDSSKLDIVSEFTQDTEQLYTDIPQLLPEYSSMSYESSGVTRPLPHDPIPPEFDSVDFSTMPGLIPCQDLDSPVSADSSLSYDCQSPASSWLPRIPALSDVNIFDIRWY